MSDASNSNPSDMPELEVILEVEGSTTGVPTSTAVLDRKNLFSSDPSTPEAPGNIVLTPSAHPQSVHLELPTGLPVLEAQAPAPTLEFNLSTLIPEGVSLAPQTSIVEESVLAVPFETDEVIAVTNPGVVEFGVKKSTRKTDPSSQKNPIEWNSDALAAETQPLAQGLALALKQGARGAIVFSFEPSTQTYAGTHSICPGYRTDLWQSLQWNPAWLPDLWKNILRMGALEIGPPNFGKINNPSGSRNVLRFALGAEMQEWISLFIIGNTKKPERIIVIFSALSLQSQFEPIKKAFSSSALSAAA